MSDNWSGIDWDAVRRRLDASTRALADAVAPDNAHVEEILRRRAEALAQRNSGQTRREIPVAHLRFIVGTEPFALALAETAEIVPRPRCTPVPGMPPVLHGVVNLHGDIRPVFDPAVILGLQQRRETDPPFAVFVRRDGALAGIVVDSKCDVVDVLLGDLMPAPSQRGPAANFIAGVRGDGLAVLAAHTLAQALTVDGTVRGAPTRRPTRG